MIPYFDRLQKDRKMPSGDLSLLLLRLSSYFMNYNMTSQEKYTALNTSNILSQNKTNSQREY